MKFLACDGKEWVRPIVQTDERCGVRRYSSAERGPFPTRVSVAAMY